MVLEILTSVLTGLIVEWLAKFHINYSFLKDNFQRSEISFDIES